MGDGRSITLYGDKVVYLNDDASMSMDDAKAAADASYASHGPAEAYAYLDDLAGIIAQCPELFQQYWDAENQQQQ